MDAAEPAERVKSVVEEPASELRRVTRLLLTFMVRFSLLWLLAFSVWKSLPYVRPARKS